MQTKLVNGNFSFALYEGQNLQSFVANVVNTSLAKQPMATYLQKALEFYLQTKLQQNGYEDNADAKVESVQQLKILDCIDKSLLLPKLSQLTDRHSMSGGENGGEIADDA